jgi:hypothetical protein
MMDAAALSAWASQALGTPIAFAVERDPVPEGGLSEGEQARYAGFSLPRRREDWLRGRAALKSLLRSLGEPEDTSGLAFPNARITLSHSAGIAVAAAFRSAPEGALGIGIDFEGHRPVKADTVRFYLSAAERARPEAAALAARDLLRLWTVKEALFKADPGNRSRGWSLGVYEVEGSLADFAGSARVSGLLSFRYLSLALDEGFLSLAVSSAVPVTG